MARPVPASASRPPQPRACGTRTWLLAGRAMALTCVRSGGCRGHWGGGPQAAGRLGDALVASQALQCPGAALLRSRLRRTRLEGLGGTCTEPGDCMRRRPRPRVSTERLRRVHPRLGRWAAPRESLQTRRSAPASAPTRCSRMCVASWRAAPSPPGKNTAWGLVGRLCAPRLSGWQGWHPMRGKARTRDIAHKLSTTNRFERPLRWPSAEPFRAWVLQQRRRGGCLWVEQGCLHTDTRPHARENHSLRTSRLVSASAPANPGCCVLASSALVWGS